MLSGDKMTGKYAVVLTLFFDAYSALRWVNVLVAC